MSVGRKETAQSFQDKEDRCPRTFLRTGYDETKFILLKKFFASLTKLSRSIAFERLSAIEILRLHGTSTLALVLQIFFGETTPCKKSADLHLRQANLLQRNNFSGVCKTSLHLTKLGWRSAEKKFSLFSNMLLLASGILCCQLSRKIDIEANFVKLIDLQTAGSEFNLKHIIRSHYVLKIAYGS
jgi:hypothetical protein